MKRKSENYKVIISDNERLSVWTRHDWSRITDEQLHTLDSYAIVSSFIRTSGIYHVLKDIDPMSFLNRDTDRPAFLLMKCAANEETGKLVLLTVEISGKEAAAIRDNYCHLV